MSSFTYTREQQKAIEADNQYLRIIACAGSGKTTTLVGKLSYILNKDDLKPENIIAFTFTEKAANELKNKVIKELNGIHGLADIQIGTIHSWCLKSLQDNLYKYQNYSVLDEIKLKIFVDKYYEQIGMKYVLKNTSNTPMRRFVDTSNFISIMGILREMNLDQNTIPENLKIALDLYKKTLNKKRYFDFSMIIDETIKELDKKGPLYEHIKNNIKYLFVDEYQDINYIQNILIQKICEISNCKLIVVGDDDQNIYRWRGSDNKYIIEFNQYFDQSKMDDIILGENHRTSEGIVTLAEKLISKNVNRIPNKVMRSAGKQTFEKSKGDAIVNIFETIDEENESIADYIENIIGMPFTEDGITRGLSYSDICILVRKWDKAQSISEKLSSRGINYITAGVNNLFETPEVKAALGLFQYLNKTISLEDLEQLWLNINNRQNTIDEKKLRLAIKGDSFTRKCLDSLSPENNTTLDKNGNKKENWEYSLQNIFWTFLELANITEDTFLGENNNQAEIIFYNLGKFSQVINDFEEINFSSISPSFYLFSFLSFVRYVAVDYYPEGWLNNEFKTPDAIQIMTIHQAKGLEFPVVIIPGLNKNYLPSKKKGGINETHFLPDSIGDLVKSYNEDDNYEDERRLLYVAITRSQKFLYISRAPDQNNRLYMKPSIFMEELSSSNVLINNKGKVDIHKGINRIEPSAKDKIKNIQLDFSTLKDFFECPYRFKLISMYGFCSPLNRRMGVGKSFHSCLMEIHKRIKDGENIEDIDLKEIEDRQIYFPYVNNSTILEDELSDTIKKGLLEYIKDETLNENIKFVEQEVQYQIDENILIVGRIDLIKKEKEFGQYETTIIEFKSKDENSKNKVTEDQLKMYALGHKELTGELANYIRTYIINVKEKKKSDGAFQIPISENDLEDISMKIKDSVKLIREESFTKKYTVNKVDCKSCLHKPLCLGDSYE